MRPLIFLFLSMFLFNTHAQANNTAEFAYGSHHSQKLDVYLPSAPRNAPILVMLHGGAWRFGDKANDGVGPDFAQHWAQQGYIYVSVNTRLLPDATPLDQAKDLAVALTYVQTQAGSWGGDASNIVLMGHSAGAHVAALLSTRKDLLRASGTQPWKGSVLLDTAVLDVAATMAADPARLYKRAFGRNPRKWKAASPIEHLSQGDPPMLIVCSTKRQTPCPEAKSFAATAAKHRIETTVLGQNLSHRDVLRQLGQSSAYTAAVDAWIRKQFQR